MLLEILVSRCLFLAHFWSIHPQAYALYTSDHPRFILTLPNHMQISASISVSHGFRASYKNILNSVGDVKQPCRSPFEFLKLVAILYHVFTVKLFSSYVCWTTCIRFLDIPLFCIACHIFVLGIESYTFFKSMKCTPLF